jgi:hypothetical protein
MLLAGARGKRRAEILTVFIDSPLIESSPFDREEGLRDSSTEASFGGIYALNASKWAVRRARLDLSSRQEKRQAAAMRRAPPPMLGPPI